MPSLLELRGLAIRAGEQVLTAGISLEVQPGELVAVTGPSGVGKTSLLRTVCGLQDPAAGSVWLQGRTGDEWGWPLFRRRLLLVSQKPVLLEMTVRENLMRPFMYHTASNQPAFDETKARQWLAELSVGEERFNQNAHLLSVGQQQRVSLIRALLLEPLVLCLDEPTSALDLESAACVETLISRLAAEKGLAALIVTHNPQQAQQWCQRRLVLSAGHTAVADEAEKK